MATANQDTSMISGGASGAGNAGIKTGGEFDTPMTSCPCPVPNKAASGGEFDRNHAPFNSPRSSGGIPVKFFEQVSGTPGGLESTFEDENIIK